MSMLFDDIAVGNQLFVGSGKPIALGIGPAKVRGSAYVEGPQIVGSPLTFPAIFGSLMVAPSANSDGIVLPIPGAHCRGNNSPYSLVVQGDAAVFNNLDTINVNAVGDVVASGNVMSQCGGHVLSAKKNFDIPHPSKPGYRLRHTCPEGPSNDVYCRGRVTKSEIVLPTYWKDLVDYTTITVTLTPIGAHQDVIVKRWDEDKVYLQARPGMPINCFYQIFATRADGERLIPEYEGTSPEDYPGNNDEYSISGYHYDRKK